MNIDDYLDNLGDIIDNAWSIPLSGGKVAIGAEDVRRIIEDIRLNLPNEIRQAKAIVADRAQILNNAKTESEHIIRAAESRAKAMLEQDEIHRQAVTRANEIMKQSQIKSSEMRRAATEFAETLLRNADDSLTSALTEVKQARSALRIPSAKE